MNECLCNKVAWVWPLLVSCQHYAEKITLKSNLHWKYVINKVWYTVYPKKYAHAFCFAVLCCGYTLTDFPYPSDLLHWHCGNLTIAPVPVKQPWWIWINTSFRIIMNDCITTTKQSTTKPCAYFLGYTVRSTKYGMKLLIYSRISLFWFFVAIDATPI